MTRRLSLLLLLLTCLTGVVYSRRYVAFRVGLETGGEEDLQLEVVPAVQVVPAVEVAAPQPEVVAPELPAQPQLLVIVTTNSSANTEKEKPNRIVGGQQISITDAPWQVALIINRTLTCGGSVLSAVWVLSAAHCVLGQSRSNMVVRAGSDYFRTGGQPRGVNFFAIHGRYNDFTSEYDIAMLRVNRRFTFGTALRPIRLPTATTRIPETFFLSGWGADTATGTNPTQRLRGVNTRFVSRNVCAYRYRNQYNITANMLCAAAPSRDSCQGDSGGALVRDGIQFGIVSFGIGCANENYPGVYTNVQRMVPWIVSVASVLTRGIPVF